MEAKYNPTDINDDVSNMDCLKYYQKEYLNVLLKKHKKLFDGTLDVYPHKTFHIDIYPEAVTIQSRAYPVHHIHLDTFKTEIQHLVRLGVLLTQGCSEWALPSFNIPKKYGRVLWISNLRNLIKLYRGNNILSQ